MITNRSSGKQGYAVAEVAARRGAAVTLVTTIGRPAPPQRRDRERADGVRDAGSGPLARGRAWTSSSRLPQWPTSVPRRRRTTSSRRTKASPTSCSSPPTTSRSTWVAPSDPGQVLVGFAAETNDLVANAARKLASKRLDLIVGQQRRRARRRIRGRHQPRRHPRRRGRRSISLPLQSKIELAGVILDRVHALLLRQGSEMTERYTFTSESVTEGHPDKMCDQISDSDPRRDLRAGPAEPRGVRVVVHHRDSSWSPVRSPPAPTSTSSASCATPCTASGTTTRRSASTPRRAR